MNVMSTNAATAAATADVVDGIETPAREISYSLHGLVRRFPGVVAVDDVSFSVGAGEIHGIIGRNGAGKSVLMSMVAGVLPPSAGEIRVHARGTDDGVLDAQRSGPARAHAYGVSLVSQEPKLARDLSVSDNLFMGRRGGRLGLVSARARRMRARELIERLALSARPDDRVGDLPIEVQQLLVFGKAVFIEDAKVILLDEITASLTSERKQMLLGLLKDITAARGDVSFTLISHHINEVIEFTDHVTVMRDGKAVASVETRQTTREELAHWIVGDRAGAEHAPVAPRTRDAQAPALLRVRDLAVGRELREASFDVDRGEVIGFAGLEGSGKDAAIETLFGLRRPDAGDIRLEGRDVALRTPKQALARGIAFLPKHREAHAVIQHRSVVDNIVIAGLSRFCNRLGLVSPRKTRQAAQALVEQLKIKTPGVDAEIDHLSGGNKQKALIGRLSLTRPRLVLLNEPTRGVDISAKPDLLRLVREELARDAGVVMISESEEELVGTCDRVYVFFKGAISAVFERGQTHFNVGEIYRCVQGVKR